LVITKKAENKSGHQRSLPFITTLCAPNAVKEWCCEHHERERMQATSFGVVRGIQSAEALENQTSQDRQRLAEIAGTEQVQVIEDVVELV
jgi:hypothetical protein